MTTEDVKELLKMVNMYHFLRIKLDTIQKILTHFHHHLYYWCHRKTTKKMNPIPLEPLIKKQKIVETLATTTVELDPNPINRNRPNLHRRKKGTISCKEQRQSPEGASKPDSTAAIPVLPLTVKTPKSLCGDDVEAAHVEVPYFYKWKRNTETLRSTNAFGRQEKYKSHF